MHLSRFFDCEMLENKGFVIMTSGFCLDFFCIRTSDNTEL